MIIHRHLPRLASIVGAVLAMSALAMASSACDKSDGAKSGGGETKAEGAPAAKASGLEPGFVKVPNIEGLQAKVPSTLEPNGIGGAAGFHVPSKGTHLSVSIRERIGDEAKQTFDEAKKAAEEFLFKKWISSEKTADGYVLQYEGEVVEGMGASHNFEVLRTIGAKKFRCDGSASTAADIAIGVEICKSLKAL